MEKRLSVCLIARDEAAAIVACLDSVLESADELLVVDTGSLDDTPRLAAAAGARVLSRPWDDDFAAARNFALKNARGRFAFFIDADERLAPADAPKLVAAAETTGLEAGRVIVENVDQAGRVMGRHRLIRLLRRRPGIRFQGRIHERPVGYEAPPRDLDVRVIHTGYDPGPEAARAKYERNRRLLDLELVDEPSSARLHWLAAQNEAALGRPAEALALARRGLDLDDGSDPSLTANLTRTEVMCLAALDRPAEEAARGFLNREPLFADLHFYLGQVRLRQGDEPGAEQALTEFLDVLRRMEDDPGLLSRFGFVATIGQAGRAARDVARLRFARQDFQGGAAILARAVGLCPGDADLRVTWAQALAAAGDLAAARRQVEVVLELDPSHQAARRLIGQLT